MGVLTIILLIAAFTTAAQLAETADHPGFLSLDCGRPSKDAPYTERTTGITYFSDSDFIHTGKIEKIDEKIREKMVESLWTLRSFPAGQTNCYHLDAVVGKKYIIRASFLYGNYDGKKELPVFDLYLGSNLWTPVAIAGVDLWRNVELTHVAATKTLKVCLVRRGKTVPFISTLELRPLPNQMYNVTDGSLLTVGREFFPESRLLVRYEEDSFDRVWLSALHPDASDIAWHIGGVKEISTKHRIDTQGIYKPPQPVIRTAVIPLTGDTLKFIFGDISRSSIYYVFMHFAEVEELAGSESREFNIFVNGKRLVGPFRPLTNTLTTVTTPIGLRSSTGIYEILIKKTKDSTRPPLINAIEVYKFAF